MSKCQTFNMHPSIPKVRMANETLEMIMGGCPMRLVVCWEFFVPPKLLKEHPFYGESKLHLTALSEKSVHWWRQLILEDLNTKRFNRSQTGARKIISCWGSINLIISRGLISLSGSFHSSLGILVQMTFLSPASQLVYGGMHSTSSGSAECLFTKTPSCTLEHWKDCKCVKAPYFLFFAHRRGWPCYSIQGNSGNHGNPYKTGKTQFLHLSPKSFVEVYTLTSFKSMDSATFNRLSNTHQSPSESH